MCARGPSPLSRHGCCGEEMDGALKLGVRGGGSAREFARTVARGGSQGGSCAGIREEAFAREAAGRTTPRVSRVERPAGTVPHSVARVRGELPVARQMCARGPSPLSRPGCCGEEMAGALKLGDRGEGSAREFARTVARGGSHGGSCAGIREEVFAREVAGRTTPRVSRVERSAGNVPRSVARVRGELPCQARSSRVRWKREGREGPRADAGKASQARKFTAGHGRSAPLAFESRTQGASGSRRG